MQASILACIVILGVSCRPNGHVVNGNANQGTRPTTDLPSAGRLIEIDPYETADDTLANDMKVILPKLGLPPLPYSAHPDEFKFRIWTNLGGLVDPQLLGIDFNAIDNQAYFFKMDRGAYAKSRKQILASPRSGWNRMIFEVKSRLTTPKGLVRDPQFSLQRDEPMIVLEVVDRAEYSRVIYGKNTAFPDGKRLIEVCEYLAFEFGIDPSCRSDGPAPGPPPSP